MPIISWINTKIVVDSQNIIRITRIKLAESSRDIWVKIVYLKKHYISESTIPPFLKIMIRAQKLVDCWKQKVGVNLNNFGGIAKQESILWLFSSNSRIWWLPFAGITIPQKNESALKKLNEPHELKLYAKKCAAIIWYPKKNYCKFTIH